MDLSRRGRRRHWLSGRILAPASSPVLRAVGANGRLEIEFDAAVGRRYSLEGRND